MLLSRLSTVATLGWGGMLVTDGQLTIGGLKAAAGPPIALVGGSGSGKSTIARLRSRSPVHVLQTVEVAKRNRQTEELEGKRYFFAAILWSASVNAPADAGLAERAAVSIEAVNASTAEDDAELALDEWSAVSR